MDKELTQAIAMACTEAEEAFMQALDKKGFGDYIALSIIAHIIDNNYEKITEEISYSNLKGLLR